MMLIIWQDVVQNIGHQQFVALTYHSKSASNDLACILLPDHTHLLRYQAALARYANFKHQVR